jgi:hypothetical protein
MSLLPLSRPPRVAAAGRHLNSGRDASGLAALNESGVRQVAQTSNRCATRRRPWRFSCAVFLLAFVTAGLVCAPAWAQTPGDQPDQPSNANGTTASSVLSFLGGGAVGLATHEAGHLLFDVIFDAKPGIAKVNFHGIPFFAITHRDDLSPLKEFVISSAGFWVQHAEAEWLLTRRPGLRREHAPFEKGVLAFDILASGAYAGAAFARTGPAQRDTRGMSISARIDERWIGAFVLAPAVLDAVRYFNPGLKWPVWASRGAKIGMFLLIVRC